MEEIQAIKVDDAVKGRISKELANTPVLFAYVFGSVVRGDADRESDVDVAIYLEENLTKKERFDMGLKLIDNFSRAMHVSVDDIDMVVLNDVPLLLQLTVTREGVVVCDNDRGAYLDFELDVMQRDDDERDFRRAYNAVFLDRLVKQGL